MYVGMYVYINYSGPLTYRGYEGGEIQFFERWGDRDPIAAYKCAKGCGVAFCGCHRSLGRL